MNSARPVPETVTLHVPFRVVKRGGRKEMQLPEGATLPRRTDSALVKALGCAHRSDEERRPPHAPQPGRRWRWRLATRRCERNPAHRDRE